MKPTPQPDSNISLKSGMLPCNQKPPAAEIAIQEKKVAVSITKTGDRAQCTFHAIEGKPPGGDYKWTMSPSNLAEIVGSDTAETFIVTPTAPGAISLTVEYSKAEEWKGEDSALLTIAGLPQINVTPATTDFASELNFESKPVRFEVRNTGWGKLNVKDVKIETGGDFKIGQKSFMSSTPISETDVAWFEVVFTPKSPGDKTANVLVISTASDLPTSIAIKGTLLALGRPSIEVVWGEAKPASGIKVKVGTIDLGSTNSSGIASYPSRTGGLPEGQYPVTLGYETHVYTQAPDPPPVVIPAVYTNTQPERYALIKLARPKVYVVWGKNENSPGTEVENVEVKIRKAGTQSPLDMEKTSFSGVSGLPWKAKGFEPGDYEVLVELKEEHSSLLAKQPFIPVRLDQGDERTHTFELMKTVHPTIEVVCAGQVANDIGVKLRKSEGEPDFDFGLTKDRGRAVWPKGGPGIPPGTYTPILTYGKNKTEGQVTPLTITIDERTNIKTLTLAKLVRPTIHVVALGTIRTPLSGVGVILRGQGADLDLGTTSAQGEAMLAKGVGLTPGVPYTIALSAFNAMYTPNPLHLIGRFEQGFEGTHTIEMFKVAKPAIQVECGTEMKEFSGRLIKEDAPETNFDFNPAGILSLLENMTGIIPGKYRVQLDYDPKLYLLEDKNKSIQIENGFEGVKKIALTLLARPKIRVVWGSAKTATDEVGVDLTKGDKTYSLVRNGEFLELKDTEDGVLPGEYTAVFTADDKRYTCKNQKVQLVAGTTDVKDVTVVKLALPQIKVVADGTDVKGIGVTLHLGTNAYPFGTTDGTNPLQTSRGLPAASFRVELTYGTTLYVPALKLEMDVKEGETDVKTIELVEVNVVTPEIKVEYHAVMFDHKLTAKQAGSETPLPSDPTCVEVSFTQTNIKRPYEKGGILACSPPNVDIYTDEACEKPLAGNNLSHQQLSTGALKLYLKGARSGEFKLSFKLNDARDQYIKPVLTAVEAKMTVVRLDLVLYRHDAVDLGKISIDPDTDTLADYYGQLHAEVLPEQIKMTTDAKVAEGRMLHVQAGGNFDRAKLVLEKIAAFPTEARDYEVVINQTNPTGAVRIFDAQSGGTEQPFPIKIKFSGLGADKTLWVEGAGATDNWRDVRLDVGIDRPDANQPGLLPRQPKRNGDWARFTVVQIKEVKVDYTPVPNEAVAWDAPKFYINLKPDPDGRKVKISATLSTKLKDVKLRFMLAPDSGNATTANWNIDFPASSTYKWKNLLAALKHLDKKDRKKLLHLSATTDANGLATKELTLSRLGGDKFYPAAYISEDPHLAKFVHGHSDLGNRKPVVATSPIQVWRKVWFEVAQPTGGGAFADATFIATQRNVFVEPHMVTADQNDMEKDDFKPLDPFRPLWQFKAGSASDDLKLCIGTHNVKTALDLFTLPTAEAPVKFQLILCDVQFDAQNVLTKLTEVLFGGTDPTGAQDVAMQSLAVKDQTKLSILVPPLQGGALVVASDWVLQEKQGSAWVNTTHSGTLDPGNITIQKSRPDNATVHVVPPAQCIGGGGCTCTATVPTALVPDADHRIKLGLQLRAALGDYAGWAPRNSVATVTKINADAWAMTDTMAHELGHLFGQVRPAARAGQPDHPKMYQDRGGSGTHCAHDATWLDDTSGAVLDPTTDGELDAQGKGAGWWLDGDCILFGYDRGIQLQWCEHCAFEWIVADLSKFK
jgi:hypothetical protein